MRTKYVELGPITSVAELKEWMGEQLGYSGVDIDLSVKSMRSEWLIADEVTDEQIEAVKTEIFRTADGPNVVLTLCNGTIVAEAGIGRDGEMEDAIQSLEGALSFTYDGDVELTEADKDATGYGVVIAYRMPPRHFQDYKAGDVELVDRYGVEVGRYRQRAGRR